VHHRSHQETYPIRSQDDRQRYQDIEGQGEGLYCCPAELVRQQRARGRNYHEQVTPREQTAYICVGEIEVIFYLTHSKREYCVASLVGHA